MKIKSALTALCAAMLCLPLTSHAITTWGGTFDTLKEGVAKKYTGPIKGFTVIRYGMGDIYCIAVVKGDPSLADIEKMNIPKESVVSINCHNWEQQ